MFKKSKHRVALRNPIEKIVFASHLLLSLLLLSSCEKKSDEIIDSRGVAPQILSAELTPSTINTDTILTGTAPKPDDILKIELTLTARVAVGSGAGSARPVLYSIKQQFQASEISSGSLSEVGNGVFSGKGSFQIRRNDVGILYVEFTAEGKQAFRSNSIVLPLRIARLNNPPVLSNLQAPDTVTLSIQDQLIRLKVKAVDPDGENDIQRVIFNSYLPDGRPSSNNPFQMLDDGNIQGSGDEAKGDSVFTRTIVLPSNTTSGTYRFEFQAFDRSNEGSNIIIHRLTVR